MTNLESVEYIPEVENNRDADEPWHVVMAPMTAGEHRKFLKAVNIKLNGQSSANRALEALGNIFEKRVSEVHGLSDIRNRPIMTGAELFENGEQDQIDDVYSALTKASQLRKGLKKSSDE